MNRYFAAPSVPYIQQNTGICSCVNRFAKAVCWQWACTQGFSPAVGSLPKWRQSSGIGGKAMIRNGEINMSEVKRILRKYWWILPLTLMSGGALGLGATMVLPKKFTSQARIQTHEQSVSTDLVKPVLTAATNARLSSMQAQIL